MTSPTTALKADVRVSDGAMLWRYSAIDRARGGAPMTGELAAGTASDARAALRRIGLQVIDVQPLRTKRKNPTGAITGRAVRDLREWWHKQCRGRRGSQRAEIYDGLATMLESGLPLLEAIQTLVDSREGENKRSRFRSMLVNVRERLRSGDSLAQAMHQHSDWFAAVDIAAVEAGQHSGTLASVLLNLAERQERSSELSHRLLGALAYPMLVLLVGLGVVAFLSVKTLPDLTKILVDAKIPVPALTARVMWFGQTLVSYWLLIVMGLALGAVLVTVLRRLSSRWVLDAPEWIKPYLHRLQPPRLIRRMLVGGLVVQLSDLLRSGVPMVEALRVLAPTQRSGRLSHLLTQAAQRIEHGDELSAAMEDRAWFDPELRRLLDIGQASGELDDMLTRIGDRYQRRAKRLIDRLTVLLEPAVLLLLASLVGVVVMAAVLPLLALQEIIQ